MKLGIFTTGFEVKHTWNGISNNAYLTAKYMIEHHNFDVYVFAPLFNGMKPIEKYKNLIIERFPIKKIGNTGYFSIDIFKKANRIDFDLIHSFHYGYFPASVGIRTAKKKHIPHIITPTFHKTQISPIKSFLFSFYNKTEGKKILLESSMVLPYNENEKKNLKRISNFKYEIIPSPIENNVFYPANKTNKTPVITYAAPMLPWKGAKIAFDICKEIETEVDNIKFKFIGGGPLEIDIKKNAGSNFVFMKNLSVKRLAEEIRSSDIVILPTEYESFGRILAESMMSGTPVVTTNVSAVPETVGDGGIIVNYGDWKLMKEEIINLLYNKSRMYELRTNAIKQAHKFRQDVIGKKIYKTYMKVL